MIFTVLLAVHILLALLLIGVILLQQGKGATAGAAFGSGASSTVFGARGSASFLTRLTAILAVLFFSNSLLLAYLYGQTTKSTSLLDQVAVPAQSAPGAPGTAQAPTKVDVGELVEKVTQGKPVDVPAPPPADVPATPAPSAPASSAPTTPAPSADTPANDVPAAIAPAAKESSSSTGTPSSNK
ncbi:MAG: preprotein translocase subunit SecG [Gammaproteobacteria bacterium]|nr:preprotein translocase subunit SecG [Gammaproteobacteria bacterium]